MQIVRWPILMGVGLFICAGPEAWADSLDVQLTELAKQHRGQAAVAVKHLLTGDSYQYRANEVMPTASLIKLAVMIEAYRQAQHEQVDLDALITLHEEDKASGSGILTSHFSSGMQICLRDAIRLMIAYSDNTATNLVLDQIGIHSTSETMASLGCPNTKIHAKVFRRDTSVFPDRSRQFGLGSTTAAETVKLLEQLHRGSFGKQESKEMIGHLLQCEDRSRLPRLLPQVKIAHKTGSVSKVRCAAGLIFAPSGPIAVCVLTAENADRRWTDDNEGSQLCAQVAKLVHDHFESPDKKEAVAAALEMGASGALVEDLQRTLNQRLKPSPDLAIDGDFGPATRASVIRFQREKSLSANGVVNAATWKALGPLVTEDSPTPAPDVVNSEQLPIGTADDLEGPPHVTCKAWAIADAKSGKVLWGHNQQQSLDFASTTKIMTAYLVMRLAEKDTDVLNETVVFSSRADRTPGSSARVRVGEKLTVGELLYGLLLPSGNDASVALAEHFGSRFGDDKESPADPLERFIAEMNRTCQVVGMSNTHFENPHGLTAEGHRSTASDLAAMAHAARKLPLFRTYVSTRQRGCALVGPGDYRRNVVWKNTNRLLPIEGYNGVKTGTTSAAGACLVSSGEREGDELLVVVLGATSSDARYVDTRNLYRWAWSKRLQP